MKIAMIGQKNVPSRNGGIELVVTTLAPLLVEKGSEVTCFNRSNEQIGDDYLDFVFENTYKGVKCKNVLTIDKRGLAALTSSFFASISAAFSKFDIVHYHAEGPSAMLWIPKLFGKKIVVTVHGLDWQRDKWKKSFGKYYIHFGEKMLAKYADEVIVLSENVKKYFKEVYNRDTIFIPNGVNKPVIRDANLITSKFGLHKDDYICALSRLTEEKGIHYLIQAFNQIKTDKKLVIAGDTSDTEEYVAYLRTLSKDNDNIIFTGFVSGEILDEVYSNAYVYVLPSNLEGMPLSLLEAMSYGNAVIGSDISEIAEVVEDKAILFKKGDVLDLKSKLEYLFENDEKVQTLKSEAQDFICNKYNWNDIADKTLNLYKKIAKK